jgi:hypothetical protein
VHRRLREGREEVRKHQIAGSSQQWTLLVRQPTPYAYGAPLPRLGKPSYSWAWRENV